MGKLVPKLEFSQSLQNQPENEGVYSEIVLQIVAALMQLPGDAVLALDDCHLLKNPLVLKLLSLLIEHLPAQFHLILCTRQDLPLPTARLRVRQQMVEIRQRDIQFTPDEALDYLQNSMGLRLSQEDALALQSRTEGWIAGLQLAALSIQSNPDPTKFVQSFTGSDRFILDYLLDEVYSRLSNELQDFLLRTSILERFSMPLCDALRSVEDPLRSETLQSNPPARSSFALIEMVERANLFLIALDNQRTWYRYHHLFSELLRHRLLMEKDSRFIANLHREASCWYETQGYLREAAKHAFQVPDRRFVIEFVERQGFHLTERSEVPLQLEWFRQLTESEISSSPWLCVIHAWALVLDNRSDYRSQVLVRLAQAENGLAQGHNPGTSACVTGHIATIRAHLVFSEPDFDPRRVIALSQQALEILPENEGTARSVNILQMSYGYKSLSDGASALTCLDQAEPCALQGGNYYGLVCCYFDRARIAHLQGKLRRAEELSLHGQESLPQQIPNIDQFLPAFHSLDIELGCIYFEWNRLEEAEQHLVRGMHRAVGMNQYDVIAYPVLAHLRLVQGNLGGMRDTLARLEHLWPDLSDLCEAIELLVSIQRNPGDPGLISKGAHWVHDHQPTTLVPGFGLTTRDEPLHMIYLAWLQIQILLGHPQESLPVIERMLCVAEENRMNHRVIELSAVQALALQAMNESEQALFALNRALCLAEPEGYIRTFDLGPSMQTLLIRAYKRGICPGYVDQIVLALQQEGAGSIEMESTLPNSHRVNHALIEPLSDREMEVLRMLTNGGTKDKIAKQLYLSPNTLKAHTQNIYEKLDVHSRIEAIARAKELGLL
jgi:LuxR family maltose regulon positive regulatory protein